MRDPSRIRKFCNQLAEIWESQCSDWRFGQLICNVFGSMEIDPFYPEEDKMIDYFKKYFKIKEE